MGLSVFLNNEYIKKYVYIFHQNLSNLSFNRSNNICMSVQRHMTSVTNVYYSQVV